MSKPYDECTRCAIHEAVIEFQGDDLCRQCADELDLARCPNCGDWFIRHSHDMKQCLRDGRDDAYEYDPCEREDF